MPPYGASGVIFLLEDESHDTWIQDGITHIGLQFWVPGDNGEVVPISDYNYSWHGDFNEHAQKYVAWGNDNDVNVMLCFFNVHEDDFDWEVARKAYIDYPDETIDNLVSKVNTLGLGGVDIDFEAGEGYLHEKTQFLSFIEKLGDTLHSINKVLSIDVAGTPCFGFPGPSDVGELAAYVDFINFMGYSNYYQSNTESFQWCTRAPSEAGKPVFSYSYIYDYAVNQQGISPSQLNYGAPTWKLDDVPSGYWGDKFLDGHLQDIQSIHPDVGIALWDLQLNAGGMWQTDEAWEYLQDFKNKTPVTGNEEHEFVGAFYSMTARNLKANETLSVKVVSIDGEVILVEYLIKDEQLSFTELKDSGMYILYMTTSSGKTSSEKIVVLK